MSLKCLDDMTCGRLQQCTNNVCQHIDIFSGDHPEQIVALCTFSLFCGFASAGNFGAGSVQVVYLLLWLHYSRREASGITQPILVGICLASWIRQRGKKHPLRNSSIIDYQLGALLLPCMLGPYIAALHLRYFLPPFALSFFIVIQLFFMLLNTLVKIIAVRRVQKAHDEVRDHIKRSNQISDHSESDLVNKGDIFEALPSFSHDQDDFYIDFQHLFKIISKSQYRDIYLAKLPLEIRENQFFDLETDEQVKVEEYLIRQYGMNGAEKLIKFEQENLALLGENDEETKLNHKYTHLKPHERHIVKAKDVYKYPNSVHELILMFLVIAFNVINFLLMGGIKFGSIIGVPRCTQSFWILFGFQIGGNYILYTIIFATQKQRHDKIYVGVTKQLKEKQLEYDKQYEEELLEEREQDKKIEIHEIKFSQMIHSLKTEGIELITNPSQILLQRIDCKQPDDFPSTPGLKSKSIYAEVIPIPQTMPIIILPVQVTPIEIDNMGQQKNAVRIETQIPSGNTKVLHKKIHHHKGARIDIKYNHKSYLTIILVGVLGGAMMGFVGVGTSLLMVMVIGRLRINLSSMLATLPMLVVFTCILGTLMQISLGSLLWEVALLFFGLAFAGSMLFVPLFTKCLIKLHLTYYIVIAAFFFQLIILAIYLLIWIPQVSKDFSKLIQYSSFTALC